MTKFEHLMDDMKAALILFSKHKKLFLPQIIGAFLSMTITIIIIVIAMVALIGGTAAVLAADVNIMTLLPIGIILALVTIILIIATSLIIDVGLINMIKGTLDGDTRGFALFKEGLKKYFFRALATSIGFLIILSLVYSILFIPVILYVLTVGLLSGGWAIILLSSLTQSLIGYWLIIMIDSDNGGFASIRNNLSFGSHHLKLMLLIFFLQTMLSSNLPSYLGMIGILVTFIIVAMTNTYFKAVILMTYRRYTSPTADLES